MRSRPFPPPGGRPQSRAMASIPDRPAPPPRVADVPLRGAGPRSGPRARTPARPPPPPRAADAPRRGRAPRAGARVYCPRPDDPIGDRGPALVVAFASPSTLDGGALVERVLERVGAV